MPPPAVLSNVGQQEFSHSSIAILSVIAVVSWLPEEKYAEFSSSKVLLTTGATVPPTTNRIPALPIPSIHFFLCLLYPLAIIRAAMGMTIKAITK